MAYLRKWSGFLDRLHQPQSEHVLSCFDQRHDLFMAGPFDVNTIDAHYDVTFANSSQLSKMNTKRKNTHINKNQSFD